MSQKIKRDMVRELENMIQEAEFLKKDVDAYNEKFYDRGQHLSYEEQKEINELSEKLETVIYSILDDEDNGDDEDV